VPEWPAGFGASDTSASDACAHTLLYERALELGEDAKHLEHGSPGGRRGIEALALKEARAKGLIPPREEEENTDP
jgi:hypothetical protein